MHRASVATIVIASLVAIATALMAALGVANYAAYRERGWAALNADLTSHADQLAIGLALPVWSIDRPAIDRILQALGAEPALYAVEVEAAGRSHVWARDQQWRMQPSDGKFERAGLLHEQRAITLSGDPIGSFQLYATPRFLEADLQQTKSSIVTMILALDSLLILSLYFMLWRSVLQPLLAIERYAVAVRSGAGGTAARIPGRGFARELESLRASIEAMVTLLDQRFGELREEVTRRAESEAAALISEKKFRDIFDLAPIGISQATPAGTIFTSNRAFGRILGYDDGAGALGLSISRDVFCDSEEWAQLVAEYAPGGLIPTIERRLKRRDGSPFWASGTAHWVRDAAGEIAYIEAFISDVSERRATQDALRASEQRYRLLFEGNPIPMLVYDVGSLAFLAINQAAVRQYGYSREELLELSVPDLALPDDENLAAFLATRHDPRPDLVHVGRRTQRCKDGRVIEVEMTSLIVAFDGHPARLILARDITAENRASAERARLEESLRRSQTMSAMGALVAGVAHEVRNPLFSISASVDALESELGQNQEYAALSQLLRSQVTRLSQLMRDLLDYGKPLVPQIAPAQPVELIRRALRSSTPLARSHGVELHQDVAADLPTLAVDASRIAQVFENLLANAVQHAPRGSAVRLHARIAASAPEAVVFSVEDDGPGIAPADLPRLFEPFFSRRKGGTGLGLPIIQKIVEAHGGQVTAANRADRGAVFTVTLPATHEPAP